MLPEASSVTGAEMKNVNIVGAIKLFPTRSALFLLGKRMCHAKRILLELCNGISDHGLF
jgi:hypothetical protein